MEILSTGKKINRARIYKGYTLKDLCSDKISVSKMSCIENGKIAAEDWVLKFVAEKLDISFEYLKLDAVDEIFRNIDKINEVQDSKKKENILEYHLKYAEKHQLDEAAFKLAHLLFNHYLDNSELEKIQFIDAKYYELWNKCGTEKNSLVYFMDKAKYLYNTREFDQAAGYYKNVRQTSKKSRDLTMLARATYNEAVCYVMEDNYERAYEIVARLKGFIDYLDSDLKKAEAFHLLAILSLKRNQKRFPEYEKKAYKLYGSCQDKKADSMFDFASVMLDLSMEEKAISYIEEALSIYPEENTHSKAKFILNCVSELVKHNLMKTANDKCNDALDRAILLDDLEYIEKAYYLKALILEAEGRYDKVELYLTMSLDALLKLGNINKIQSRYLHMGEIYHRMGNTSEALKYLNFALRLEKNI